MRRLKHFFSARPLPGILVILDMANPKYAASDKPVPVAELVDTLSDGTKVKRRIPRMRACNEKDAKGKLCAGHLKRWYFFGDEVKQNRFRADLYYRLNVLPLTLPPLRQRRSDIPLLTAFFAERFAAGSSRMPAIRLASRGRCTRATFLLCILST